MALSEARTGMLLDYVRSCITEMEQQESTEQNEN